MSSDDVEYFGFAFHGSRATIQVASKAIQKFKHRIRELTARSRGISMEDRFRQLNRYTRGSMGYFAFASQLKLFDRFDQWLRRRIRLCFWKRWSYPRTRRRNLFAMGVPRRQAIRHARTCDGPWHMAKSIATGVGMTNDWLKQQGLLSLKSLWATLAPTRRTA